MFVALVTLRTWRVSRSLPRGGRGGRWTWKRKRPAPAQTGQTGQTPVPVKYQRQTAWSSPAPTGKLKISFCHRTESGRQLPGAPRTHTGLSTVTVRLCPHHSPGTWPAVLETGGAASLRNPGERSCPAPERGLHAGPSPAQGTLRGHRPRRSGWTHLCLQDAARGSSPG